MIEFEVYIDTVLTNAILKWDELSKNLCSGDIKFKIISSYFGKNSYEWKIEFRTLMEYQRLDPREIKHRFDQIDINYKLKDVSRISKILSNIKDTFGLIGDFKSLDKIVESVS